MTTARFVAILGDAKVVLRQLIEAAQARLPAARLAPVERRFQELAGLKERWAKACEPLPGSEDHKVLWQKGTWMDPDMNQYDLNNRVTHHPAMTDSEWEGAFNAAWESFYSLDHIRTVLRRSSHHGDLRITFVLTARHTPQMIDRAIAALTSARADRSLHSNHAASPPALDTRRWS